VDLISVSQIVNEKNCDVLFSRKKVSAIDRSTRKETIIGKKKSKDKLWQTVDGNESKGSERSKALSAIRSAAHLAITNSTTDAEYIKLSSECFGNPPTSTLIKACQKGWLSTYPRLTAKMIRANPPKSPAISDGHLNKNRQNVQLTDPDKLKRSNSNKHAACMQYP
jgi:hypothetical protein